MLEIEFRAKGALVPSDMHFVLDCNRNTIKRPQRLAILISLRGSLGRCTNDINLRFEESCRVFPRRCNVASHEGKQGFNDSERGQSARGIQGMVVGGRVVVVISFSPLHGRRWGVAGGIVDGNHGGIITARVLVEMGDFANDVEPGIAPEVALNKADIMDSM